MALLERMPNAMKCLLDHFVDCDGQRPHRGTLARTSCS